MTKNIILLKKTQGGYILNFVEVNNFDIALHNFSGELSRYKPILQGKCIVAVHGYKLNEEEKGKLISLFSKQDAMLVKSLETIDSIETFELEQEQKKKKSKNKANKFINTKNILKKELSKKQKVEETNFQKPQEIENSLNHNNIENSKNLQTNLDQTLNEEQQITDNEAQNQDGLLIAQFVQGPLRSGRVFTSNGHVIVIGNVNEGAEIYAVGNIVVIGTIKGIVHAGCKGDENAFVISNKLDCSQIRIAQHIYIKNLDEKLNKNQTQTRASIKNGEIVLE